MLNKPPRKSARTALRLMAAAGSCLGLLSIFGSGSALAYSGPSSAVAASSSRCEGQIFTQAFALFGDQNWYLLTPGSQFNTEGEGWTFSGGAQITESRRPFGLRGDVLEMPSGSEAVSPPVCVNMNYETAKFWARRTSGGGSVKVSVSYAGTRSENRPVKVADFYDPLPIWDIAEYPVEPGLAPGEAEAAREVTFTFLSHGGSSTNYQVYGVYVDPRML